MLKNLHHKGAMFIEYALILAFATFAGIVFISSNGISKSVATIFGKAGEELAIALNPNWFTWSSDQGVNQTKFWHTGGYVAVTDYGWHYKAFSSKELVDLTPGDYTISFDIDKFHQLTGINKGDKDVAVYYMGYDGKTIVWDEHTTENSQAGYISNFTGDTTGKIYTTTFTVDKGISLGFNIEDTTAGTTENDQSTYNKLDETKLGNALRDSITITKKL